MQGICKLIFLLLVLLSTSFIAPLPSWIATVRISKNERTIKFYKFCEGIIETYKFQGQPVTCLPVQ